MAARVIQVQSFALAVFGATGDLSRRKLYPALWRRFAAGQCPPEARIIGVARQPLDDESFRRLAADAVCAADAAAATHPLFADFLKMLSYVQLDLTAPDWQPLARALAAAPPLQLFYLALAPSFTEAVCRKMADSGFLGGGQRLILEKPFGRDLQEARALNATLSALAPETDIYRIDHYLGKETVQNLMVLRFANSLWEPIWNARGIDHVQITVAEDIGVQGRGAYYDGAGALRDMLQNHLLQLLCLTAMEPPSHYAADDVRDQKLQVLKSLRPLDGAAPQAVLGQYAAGNGMPSYRDDIGGESSATETFVAVKCMIDNWRWADTPFYLRTGKRLPARMSEIAVRFKPPAYSIFSSSPALAGNTLIIRLQPQECITLLVNIKEPGPGGLRIVEVPLDMSFAQTLEEPLPDAYERLLMDVVRGDQTLFMRADELEAAWEWIMPALQHADESAPQPYACGSSGPEAALQLMHFDRRAWRPIV